MPDMVQFGTGWCNVCTNKSCFFCKLPQYMAQHKHVDRPIMPYTGRPLHACYRDDWRAVVQAAKRRRRRR